MVRGVMLTYAFFSRQRSPLVAETISQRQNRYRPGRSPGSVGTESKAIRVPP